MLKLVVGSSRWYPRLSVVFSFFKKKTAQEMEENIVENLKYYLTVLWKSYFTHENKIIIIYILIETNFVINKKKKKFMWQGLC